VVRQWSAEEQRDLFRKLGYDYSQYKPENKAEGQKVLDIAIDAQLNGVDSHGNTLSHDDMLLLSTITGHR